MYISMNWVKDFVNLDGLKDEDIIKRFTMSTAEVEGIEYKGSDLSGVYTAKIVSVQNHPNSKKLHILQVECGETLQIVCGAPNVREGMIVPLAKIGAHIGGVVIDKATLGGVDSYGMCCSAKECGISDDNSGLYEFEPNTSVGVDIKKILPIDDVVFEVDNKSLTNRPDLWGHYGIAREISALTNRPLKKLDVYEGLFGSDNLDIENQSKYCYRYTSAVVKNITKHVSTPTMQIRLIYAGMRPINLLADITNYVMLELGQPMHAFDAEAVKKIVVTDLKNDVNFVTLDGVERKLHEDTCVITDGDKVTAIAGVMGGLDSEIKDNTNSVLIESACFSAGKIRKTATSLGLRTEASARYEKSLDPELTEIALRRFIYILREIDENCIVSSKIIDNYSYHYPHVEIRITKDYIDKYTGIDIKEDEIMGILNRLQLKTVKVGNEYVVDVPSFRATKDISGKADIVEEVTRVYGYDNIMPSAPVQAVNPVNLDSAVDDEYNVKLALALKYNYHEIHSYIWYDSETNKLLNIQPKSYVKVLNSIQKDNDEIRSTLVPTMLKVVLDNKNNMDEVRVCEVGHAVVGMKDDGNVDEHKFLCVANYAQTNNLIELKNAIEYIVKNVLNREIEFRQSNADCAYMLNKNYFDIYVAGEKMGYIGLIHPVVLDIISTKHTICVCEIDMTKLSTTTKRQTLFRPVSKFPETILDFSFVVDKDTLYEKISHIATSIQLDAMQSIKNDATTTQIVGLNYAGNSVYYDVKLVDTFDMSDKKSVTLRYTLINYDHTFTTNELNAFHSAVINAFASNGIDLKM